MQPPDGTPDLSMHCLLAGAGSGLLSGFLLALLWGNGEAAESLTSMALVATAWGILVGGFGGGMIGLAFLWRGWSRGRAAAIAAAFPAAGAVLLVAGNLIVQALAG